jgi:hypothetical protein
MVGFLIRIIFAYVVMAYLLSEPDPKQRRMLHLQQGIKLHRRLAEWHGSRVISLENTYKRVCES